LMVATTPEMARALHRLGASAPISANQQEIYELLQAHDAKSDPLSIVGSYGDTIFDSSCARLFSEQSVRLSLMKDATVDVKAVDEHPMSLNLSTVCARMAV
jgi:hypothetical protein